MCGLRSRLVVAVVCVCCRLLTASTAEAAPLRLQLVRAGHVSTATCWLLHRQDDGGRIVLHFVTAGHLFKAPSGERLAAPDSIRVRMPDGREIEVASRGITLPASTVVDLALIRATVTATSLVPLRVGFAPPLPGGEFEIAGLDEWDNPVDVAQRVRIKTSGLLLGDREATKLSGCEGAPAIAAQAVFGIVVSCERGQVVVVSLLQLAESFMRHHVPGFDGSRVRPTEELR